MRGRICVVFVVAAVGGCAGYQVGHQSLSRPDIRTVAVPIFRSDTLRRDLGEWLTEAVVEEIESATAYRVVGDSTADSRLVGRIIDLQKEVIGEDRFDVPRSLSVRMVVEVSWTDRAGRPLFQTLVLPVPAPLLDIETASTLIPEAGQSITSAELDAIRRLARQVRGQMEVDWTAAP